MPSPHPPPVRAVVWDFDNTLADTRIKNLRVTRRIIEAVTGRPAGTFPALATPERFEAAVGRSHAWQELYARELGLDPDEVARAGALWTEYQLADPTPTPPFAGIPEAVRALAHMAQGICSMNSRTNIRASLGEPLLAHFEVVVGHEEVAYDRQKPAPDGLLLCVERLTGYAAEATVLFVGDHEVDGECAEAANRELERRGHGVRVAAVAATYGSTAWQEWRVRPGLRARTPSEVVEIARTLAAG